ncbi:hypothetical protein [Aliivibrio fischeri]|uniref:hypothetical protein n=1 Tax=Aliivibrio fischeri TaxID=668 RepID=UPI000AC5BE49|nr:hypothetical protein [Aliivibrio fischeri]
MSQRTSPENPSIKELKDYISEDEFHHLMNTFGFHGAHTLPTAPSLKKQTEADN